MGLSSVPLAPQHTEYRAERSFLVSMHLILQHNSHIALDIDERDEAELDEESLNRLHSFYPHVFGRIVADEAQKLKTPSP